MYVITYARGAERTSGSHTEKPFDNQGSCLRVFEDTPTSDNSVGIRLSVIADTVGVTIDAVRELNPRDPKHPGYDGLRRLAVESMRSHRYGWTEEGHRKLEESTGGRALFIFTGNGRERAMLLTPEDPVNNLPQVLQGILFRMDALRASSQLPNRRA